MRKIIFILLGLCCSLLILILGSRAHASDLSQFRDLQWQAHDIEIRQSDDYLNYQNNQALEEIDRNTQQQLGTDLNLVNSLENVLND